MQWKEFYRLKFSIYRLKFRKIYIYIKINANIYLNFDIYI